jgi:hypothetical protein
MIKSNVNLHLEPNAKIISSMDENDFKLFDEDSHRTEHLSSGQGASALLSARGAKNISVTGMGTIDGEGHRFLEEEKDGEEYVLVPIQEFRPKLIDFEGCTDVLFRDVTLYHAASWGLHLTGCNRVNIEAVKILGQHRAPNNDGIDPDGCKDVHISNCHVETGDDCIVVKNTKYAAEKYGACENITVSNCTLESHDSAVKIGTETHGDIRNVVIQNCIIRNSNRGLGVWVRDGGTVENILFSNLIIQTRLFTDEKEHLRNIRWWGKGEPIFISAEKRNEKQNVIGKIKNIRFEHIQIEAEGGIYIEGSPESVVENISIRSIHHTMRVKSGFPGGLFDTQPSIRGVFAHAIPAIFLRYAKNLLLNDVEVLWDGTRNKNWSNAIVAENIEQLSLRAFSASAAKADLPVVHLKSVKELSVVNCKANREVNTFMALENVATKGLFVSGNDFSKAKMEVDFSEELNSSCSKP